MTRGRLIWLAVGIIAVELLGVAGLVLAFTGGIENYTVIAVCGALIVVPILFGIALRSEIKRRRDKTQ